MPAVAGLTLKSLIGKLERATFVQWQGATQYVGVAGSASTTVNLPAQPITLTAMFNLPPIITTQPTNLPVIHGSNVTFSVTVLGTPPLAY